MANGLVCSHLNYCDTTIGQASDTNLQQLQRVQNKAVRTICRADYRADPKPLREQLEWLDLDGKRNVHLATLVYRCINGEAPEALQELFKKPDGGYQTRSSLLPLKVPNYSSSNGQKTLSFRGAILFNALPNCIYCPNHLPIDIESDFDLIEKRSCKCCKFICTSANDCRQIAYHYFKNTFSFSNNNSNKNV